MKLSKREQSMVLSLGFLGIGLLYYQFGYENLVNMVNAKTEAKSQVEEKYNKAVSTVDSLETQKSKVTILNEKISAEAAPLYPTISQEHIVLELNQLLKESGLTGGMTFQLAEVKAVEALKKSENDKEIGQSSLQKMVDDFNSKYGTGETSSGSSSSSSSSTSSTISSTVGSATTTTNSTSEGNTVTQLKVNVDFTGSYESVNKFLNVIGNYKRKITVSSISMTQKSLDEVAGSVSLVIYSIPKIDDDLSTYLTWNLDDTYGKISPFNIDSPTGTGIKSVTASSDFLIGVHSSTSVLPKVIIGRANDELRSTYAYSDGNSVQDAEMVLTEEDGKYYYKYKTSFGSTPENYNGVGNEFVPSGDNIVLNVSSENRVNSDDKSGLKLKIVNDTDKLVEVNITGDDSDDPRVSIDGDSKNISVNKK